MMLYTAYVYYTNTTLTTGVIKLNDINRKGKDNATNWQKLANPGAITYHYEGWLFVNSSDTTRKAIFWKDTTGLSLRLKESTLTLESGKTNNDANGPTPAVDGDLKILITEKFPLQKWVYFVINVINQNIVEIYLNGKLIKTEQLSINAPNNTRGTLYLGASTNSVDGYVTKFKRDPVALLADEVWKNYLAGNGLATFTNWLAGYNASFSVHSGTEEIKKVSLL
jgi:hypothetical protein